MENIFIKQLATDWKGFPSCQILFAIVTVVKYVVQHFKKQNWTAEQYMKNKKPQCCATFRKSSNVENIFIKQLATVCISNSS